jgi:hypothetical protein
VVYLPPTKDDVFVHSVVNNVRIGILYMSMQVELESDYFSYLGQLPINPFIYSWGYSKALEMASACESSAYQRVT